MKKVVIHLLNDFSGSPKVLSQVIKSYKKKVLMLSAILIITLDSYQVTLSQYFFIGQTIRSLQHSYCSYLN